jgi:hypothetical protein
VGPQGVGLDRPGFSRSRLFAVGDTPDATSVAIAADGLGLLSWRQRSGGISMLRVAHCANLACSSVTTPPPVGQVSAFSDSSIAIGSDGFGLISYLPDGANVHSVAVLHCGNAACSTHVINNVDGCSPCLSLDPSITIGSDGLGLISYQYRGELRAAHCWDVACSSVSRATLEGGESVRGSTSITVGADGLGLVSYATAGELKVAHCSDDVCSSATTTTVDIVPVAGTSITVGSDGFGLISYRAAGDLKVAHCTNAACSASTLATLDTVDDRSSMTVGADGLGLISYSTNGNLKVAHCRDLSCSTAATVVVAKANPAGAYSSASIGPDGLPLISYQGVDPTTGEVELLVAHCSNVFCVPYFRRR